jgi:hypothetical protein
MHAVIIQLHLNGSSARYLRVSGSVYIPKRSLFQMLSHRGLDIWLSFATNRNEAPSYERTGLDGKNVK